MKHDESKLTLKYLGINTHQEPVIYIREDSHICISEGFNAQARIKVTLNNKTILATLNTVETSLLHRYEASLSNYAWHLLNARHGDKISISHPNPLESIDYIRSKIYGHTLKEEETFQIIDDIVSGRLSDINIAMYIAASAGDRLSKKEVCDLTKAMVKTGQSLNWQADLVVDKHCIGGLPGNRTTPIVVAIVAAFGLMIPKTSSRAITSPAGTADVMEVFTNVDLNINTMKKVVEKENGCLVWGGSIALSPADDLLIRIERTANIDSEGQMVASILSKKIAAGSTHVVIDIPIGPTTKVHSLSHANVLKELLEFVAKEFNIKTKIIFTDGLQPVGRGIGPALEACDVLSVLQVERNAPSDLRTRALKLAGEIIEFSSEVKPGNGFHIAQYILDSGQALMKFQAICEAQGGLRSIPTALYSHTVESPKAGTITAINNHYIARIAKLAGAPYSKASGVEILTPLNTIVEKNQPLFKIYSETSGELNYAVNYLINDHCIFHIEENE